MQHHESQKLVLKIIAAGFALSFFLNILALFFPVDMSQNPPHYSRTTLILQSLATSLIIFSSTIMGMKLTEEKRTLPSGGFAMYAIANGIGLVIFFEIRQFTTEEYEKIYDIYTSATALMVPAVLLLLSYNDIPRWLRFLPLLFIVSMIIPLMLYYSGYREYNTMDEISFFGYMLMNFVHLLWGIFIWRQSARIKSE